MNPEQPQNKKSDSTEAFDNDEMEINVSYEEITPEEQLEIKKRVVNDSNSISDVWMDENPEIIDVEEQVDTTDTSVKPDIRLEEKNAADNTDSIIEDLSSLYDTESEPIESESIESEPVADEINSQLNNSETTKPANKFARDLAAAKTTNKSVEKPAELEPNLEPNLESNPDNSVIEYSESEIGELINEAEARSGENIETPDSPKKANEKAISAKLRRGAIELEAPTIETTPDMSASEVDTSEKIETPKNLDRESTPKETLPSTTTTELIADSWLDEPETTSPSSEEQNQRHQDLTAEIDNLERQKTDLQVEINTLKVQKEAEIAKQTQEIADRLGFMIEEGTRELKERKSKLLVDIEKLERRKERIDSEMRRNFAGASQDLAVRVQGFKEYLVGSLQDLATAAERLDLPQPGQRTRPPQEEIRPSRQSREGRQPREYRDREGRPNRQSREGRETREGRRPLNSSPEASNQPQFTEQTFADQTRRIRQLLDKYRTQPDYYGSPWQLRRTFEPIHAERVQEWFFDRGGRGAIKGMGSRLQNILVASAIVSVLYRLYSDRVRILILVDTPEKLGEWRRGVQDCLGVSRNDFGSDRGIVLFESADVLTQRADRLLKDKLLPLIIIDETEESINLALLKFPLWLAFAEKPQPRSSGYLY